MVDKQQTNTFVCRALALFYDDMFMSVGPDALRDNAETIIDTLAEYEYLNISAPNIASLFARAISEADGLAISEADGLASGARADESA